MTFGIILSQLSFPIKQDIWEQKKKRVSKKWQCNQTAALSAHHSNREPLWAALHKHWLLLCNWHFRSLFGIARSEHGMYTPITESVKTWRGGVGAGKTRVSVLNITGPAAKSICYLRFDKSALAWVHPTRTWKMQPEIVGEESIWKMSTEMEGGSQESRASIFEMPPWKYTTGECLSQKHVIEPVILRIWQLSPESHPDRYLKNIVFITVDNTHLLLTDIPLYWIMKTAGALWHPQVALAFLHHPQRKCLQFSDGAFPSKSTVWSVCRGSQGEAKALLSAWPFPTSVFALRCLLKQTGLSRPIRPPSEVEGLEHHLLLAPFFPSLILGSVSADNCKPMHRSLLHSLSFWVRFSLAFGTFEERSTYNLTIKTPEFQSDCIPEELSSLVVRQMKGWWGERGEKGVRLP